MRPPLLTLLAAAALLYLALIPANRLIVAASAPAADPQAAAFLEEYGTILQIAGVLAVPITMLLMVGFTALVLWGAGQAAGVALPLDRALLIATYAAFVLLLGQVVGAGLALLHSGGSIDVARDLSVGPARFYPAGEIPAATHALLRRFELFALWQATLWGVGVRWVARTSAARAAAVAVACWALLALPGLLFALVQPAPPV